VNVIPPAARPRVVLRYANNSDLLVSGLLDNGCQLAQRAAVIDASLGQGHVVLSNNPAPARPRAGMVLHDPD
jgi:hypothetical protein